jgi:ribonuclease T2
VGDCVDRSEDHCAQDLDRRFVFIVWLGCWLRAAIFGHRAASRPQVGGDTSQAAPGAVRTSDAIAGGAGSHFDFYLLNLSWSPEFCVAHPSGVECSQHRGFIVHGLWPQNSDGSYPQHGGSRPRPKNPAAWADVMPDGGLMRHEWQTHGTCTPYDAYTYFGMIRKAFRQVQVPAVYVDGTQAAMLAPAAILADFAKVNPGFPAGSLALKLRK